MRGQEGDVKQRASVGTKLNVREDMDLEAQKKIRELESENLRLKGKKNQKIILDNMKAISNGGEFELMQELGELKQTNNDLEAKLQMLQVENEVLSNDLRNAMEELDETRNTMTQLVDQNEDLQREMEMMKQMVEKIKFMNSSVPLYE